MQAKKVKNIKKEVLSDNRFSLLNLSFDYSTINNGWNNQKREVYNAGNGSAILLYNVKYGKVVLIRQFRISAYMNGNDTGILIEICAGLLDGDNPEDCIKKETEEETGYHLSSVRKVFEAYMSPGCTTENLHFFIAEYDAAMKKGSGGGLVEEQEDIEVLELKFDKALEMIESGEIKDAKTIMLLQYIRLKGIL